jgi:hypothetical protein
MSLGLQITNSANIIPHVKYDARAGRLFRVDRVQDASGAYQRHTVDITTPAPTFIMDLAGIQVGWLHFSERGPDFHLVRLGQPLPAKPSDQHRQGFLVHLYAARLLGGVRQFSSNAKTVVAAMDALHSEYEKAPEVARGLVPVVTLAGTVAVKTASAAGQTTSYAPVFRIEKWVERPPELDEAAEPAKPATPTATAAPSAQHVPPPAPRPVTPEPVPADAPEF